MFAGMVMPEEHFDIEIAEHTMDDIKSVHARRYMTSVIEDREPFCLVIGPPESMYRFERACSREEKDSMAEFIVGITRKQVQQGRIAIVSSEWEQLAPEDDSPFCDLEGFTTDPATGEVFEYADKFGSNSAMVMAVLEPHEPPTEGRYGSADRGTTSFKEAIIKAR
jgi:hypothetical protein